MTEEKQYYVDDIVSHENAEFAVSAHNPDGFLTLIPLGKGLPKRVKPDLVSLVKSRIRELRAIKNFPDFIQMITNVEATYNPKGRKKSAPKTNEITVKL